MSDVRILVAAHKPYWVPSDELYLPVEVGAALRDEHIDGFTRDDTGDNISIRNGRLCELTALYWGWKNLEADAVGLVHYRRYFAGAGERGVLTHDEARRLLAEAPVVVPKRRNYVIESLGSHYAHTHSEKHLEALREAVRKVSPQRLEVYDRHLASTRGHMFNMLLMKREVLDPYATWLFDVLDAAEGRVDHDGMQPFQERYLGRLGELLLDVWLMSERVPYREVGLRELERVNWIKKGASFLAAKFLGRKYNKSF